MKPICEDPPGGVFHITVVEFNMLSFNHVVNEKYKNLFSVGVNEMRSIRAKHAVICTVWQSHKQQDLQAFQRSGKHRMND